MKKIGLPLNFTKDTKIQDLVYEIIAKKHIKDSIKNLVKY